MAKVDVGARIAALLARANDSGATEEGRRNRASSAARLIEVPASSPSRAPAQRSILTIPEVTRYEAATGFLVKLGGRAFVFTAKHNLRSDVTLKDETPRTTGVAFPRTLTIPVHIGEGVRRFFRGEADVDAAVIELDPNQSV